MARTSRPVGASAIGAVITVRPSLSTVTRSATRFDFGHSMGDIDDRHAFPAQALNEIEQARRVIAIERGGRFVHHENARVDGESLCDLDQLLLGDHRLPAPVSAGIDEPRRREQTLCVVAHLAPIQHAVARRLDAEKDVLRDAPMRQEAQLLMDDADAGAARRDGVRKFDLLTVEEYPALSGR